jgi:hypothetical protein
MPSAIYGQFLYICLTIPPSLSSFPHLVQGSHTTSHPILLTSSSRTQFLHDFTLILVFCFSMHSSSTIIHHHPPIHSANHPSYTSIHPHTPRRQSPPPSSILLTVVLSIFYSSPIIYFSFFFFFFLLVPTNLTRRVPVSIYFFWSLPPCPCICSSSYWAFLGILVHLHIFAFFPLPSLPPTIDCRLVQSSASKA